MGTWSVSHWLILLVIVLLLFGAGKIPQLMGDMAKGIKTFKKGMQEDEDPAKPADGTTPKPVDQVTAKAPTSEPSKVG